MTQNSTIEAVAWDVDGTLIDSEWLRREAISYALEHMGVKLNSELSMFGLSWDMIWKKIGQPENHTEEFSAICTDYYVKNIRRLAPRENVLEIVMRIAALGLPQMTVSNNRREIAEANIMWLDLQDVFAGHVAQEDIISGESAPEIYALAASKLGVRPDKVLAVEDSSLGAAAAYQAGLQTLFWPQDQGLAFENTNLFYHKQIVKIEEILELIRHKGNSRLTPEMFNALRSYGNLNYSREHGGSYNIRRSKAG